MEERFQQPADWQWKDIVETSGLRMRTGSLVRHEKPVANLVIGPGMREFTEKYFETIKNFSDLGYNIYFINWIGQGGSDSLLPGRFHRIRDVFGFDRDARDLISFVSMHVPYNAPRVYLGHSMGGLIGLLALAKSPHLFHATSVLAPFLGYYNPHAGLLEKVINVIPLSLKRLQSFIPGGSNWAKRGSLKNTLGADDYSSDPVRMHLHDEWTSANPALCVGDLTLGGFKEACRAIQFLKDPGVPERITSPLLIFSAGQEKIVSTKEIFNMASRIPNATHAYIADAKHEIAMETDHIRDYMIAQTDRFFRQTVG